MDSSLLGLAVFVLVFSARLGALLLLCSRFAQGLVAAYEELERPGAAPALELWLFEMAVCTLGPEFVCAQAARESPHPWVQSLVYFRVEQGRIVARR